MRSNRTYNICESAILVIYYLKGKIRLNKIEGIEEDKFWDSLFSFSLEKIRQYKSQNKHFYFAKSNNKKITTGGHIDDSLYKKAMEIRKEHKFKIYEFVELSLYLYAREVLTDKEIEFFEIELWGIMIN